MRRIILSIAMLVMATLPLGGCILEKGSDSKSVLRFVNQTDDNLTQMSKEERRDVLDFMFGDALPYIDQKAVDALMADPVKLRNDLRGSFFAQSYALQQSTGTAPSNASDEEKAAWNGYLDLLKDFNAGVVEQRLALVEKRLGDWYQFMRPSTLQAIIWDDAAFNRFLSDDEYAKSLLLADGAIMRDYNPGYRSDGQTERDQTWRYLLNQNGGLILNPNPLTTRTGS